MFFFSIELTEQYCLIFESNGNLTDSMLIHNSYQAQLYPLLVLQDREVQTYNARHLQPKNILLYIRNMHSVACLGQELDE